MVQRADAAGQHGLRVLEVSVLHRRLTPNADVLFFPNDSRDTQGLDRGQHERSAGRAILISCFAPFLERDIRIYERIN